jgi:hypothetical protein
MMEREITKVKKSEAEQLGRIARTGGGLGFVLGE